MTSEPCELVGACDIRSSTQTRKILWCFLENHILLNFSRGMPIRKPYAEARSWHLIIWDNAIGLCENVNSSNQPSSSAFDAADSVRRSSWETCRINESSNIDFFCMLVWILQVLQLRLLKGRGTRSYKGYIAVFVCFSTRVVHLEIAQDILRKTSSTPIGGSWRGEAFALLFPAPVGRTSSELTKSYVACSNRQRLKAPRSLKSSPTMELSDGLILPLPLILEESGKPPSNRLNFIWSGLSVTPCLPLKKWQRYFLRSKLA